MNTNLRYWRTFWCVILLAFALGVGAVPTASAQTVLGSSLQGNALTLTWPTNDPTLGLQYTTNLSAPNWITLHTASVSNSVFTVRETMTNRTRYYRLVGPCAVDAPPVPVVYLRVKRNTQTTSVPLTDLTQTVLLNLIDTISTFDASQSFDPASCTNGTLTFHWLVNTPTVEGFGDAGITGYHSPVLNIEKNSLVVGNSNFILEVTSTRPPFRTTIITIIANVFKSGLTPDMSTSCLSLGPCGIAAALPPTEPL
ncbi:MAG: hypothetical protein JWQ71_3351 [Pedosphaera sp.]|nr:hypothetical protein [Pedosphaera sp.]